MINIFKRLERSNSRFFDLLFLLLMILWLLIFFYFDGVFQLQALAGFLLFSTYVFWGITIHWLDKTLHLKNVLEYILIGFIGFVIIVFLID